MGGGREIETQRKRDRDKKREGRGEGEGEGEGEIDTGYSLSKFYTNSVEKSIVLLDNFLLVICVDHNGRMCLALSLENQSQ
jgi:hypothetical protein